MSGQVYSEPFAQIPEWVLDADVSDRAIRVFGLLHRHASKAGYAFPGRAKLAKRAKCSTASLDRALNELREIGAIQSRHRTENGGVIGNDYWLWPATAPSSQVSTPSVTDDATPGRVDDATPDAPVTQQEEREPVNESHRNESHARGSSSGDTSSSSTGGEEENPMGKIWFNPYREYSDHYALRALERREATIGPPTHPAMWKRYVSDQWARDNLERLAEALEAAPDGRALTVDEVVDAVERGDRPKRKTVVVGCEECGFSGWHDTGERAVIRCEVTG